MPTLVANCPRCGANDHTFDVPAHTKRSDIGAADWCRRAEVFAICRRCKHSTIFIVEIQNFAEASSYNHEAYWKSDVSLNQLFRVLRYVNLSDNSTRKPPEHLPDDIAQIYNEGCACLAMQCFNAAGTMFRLCLDMATKDLLPEDIEGSDAPTPNRKQRRDLGLRLPWLIENRLLPEDLAELTEVVREDGNDGAHAGTLTKVDAEDLADFTEVLLERLYTEPARITLAKARRVERRA